MRIHLMVIILFMTCSTAQAATCTQANLTGKWRFFVTMVDTGFDAEIEWAHCTLDFLSTGFVKTSTSSCKTFDGGTATFTSAAKLTVSTGCAVSGTLTINATEDVDRLVVNSAQIDLGKSVMAGVGRTNLANDRFSFTAIKQ